MALIGIQRINDIMYGIYGLINFGTFNKIKAINTLSSGILIPWQKALNHQPGIKNTNYIFNKVLELGMKIKKPAKSTKLILPTRQTSAFLLGDTRCTIKPLWFLRGSSVAIFWTDLREPHTLLAYSLWNSVTDLTGTWKNNLETSQLV